MTFLAFGDNALVGVGHDVFFISHAGRAAQTIALPRGFDFVKTAIGGDGAVWFADGNGSAGRVDPTGRFSSIELTSVALAIVADGSRTDVLEANAIESFDAKGVVHRIPLGRTISRGSIAALPNEIVVAADGIAGIIRIDRDNRVETLKLDMICAPPRCTSLATRFGFRSSPAERSRRAASAACTTASFRRSTCRPSRR